MDKKTVMIVVVTALIVLIAANKIRTLPLVNKLPTV